MGITKTHEGIGASKALRKFAGPGLFGRTATGDGRKLDGFLFKDFGRFSIIELNETTRIFCSFEFSILDFETKSNELKVVFLA